MAFWRSKQKTDDEGASDAADASASRVASAAPAGEKTDGGLFSKLTGGLQKTRRILGTDIRDLFKSEGRLVDEAFLGELFARLIRTDMGTRPANRIKDEVAKQYRGRVVQLEVVVARITEEI